MEKALFAASDQNASVVYLPGHGAVLHGFRDMSRLYIGGACQVSDSSGNLDYAVVCPRRETVKFHSGFQEFADVIVQTAEFPDHR